MQVVYVYTDCSVFMRLRLGRNGAYFGSTYTKIVGRDTGEKNEDLDQLAI